MPAQPDYPGVYIEEVPSQVRTIVGVATSVTAFIGRARKGSVDEPILIHNYGDYERKFGGLWMPSTMSYAAQHYFQNGGADALIVRLVDKDGETAVLEDLGTAPNLLDITAGSVGEWGNRIHVDVVTGDSKIILTEAVESGSSSPVALNVVEIPGLSTGDSIDEENDIAHVLGNMPGSDASGYLVGGSNPARSASVRLPVTMDILALEADSAGPDGNDLRATVVHSVSDPERFALILEDVTDPTAEEVYENLTVGDLSSELSGSSLVAMTSSAPSVRPVEVDEVAFDGGDAGTKATLEIAAITQSLDLNAANPGAWGNNLQVMVDHDTSEPSDTDLFNLTIQELDDQSNIVRSETFRNLLLADDAPRYIKTVLAEESDLVRVVLPLPADRPQVTASPLTFSGGDDGGELEDADYQGSRSAKTGIYALEDADLFNMLCIPPPTRSTDVSPAVWSDALAYCKEERAMLIVDPPSNWNDPSDVTDGSIGVDSLNLRDENATVYFPHVRMPDPLRENRPETFTPCGVVAGVIARTDAERGVWKAPAGIEATLNGVRELTYKTTDSENGELNPIGVNVLRTFPVTGHVVWGARTLRGADRLASQWKYLPVRRLALFIEESLYRGTQWVVFEPNDEPLWAQIRLNVGAFMQNLFRQGAFQGTSPRDAYFVKCDSETTTQNDIDRGIVNVVVGFAPLKPAEFVIIKIQQIAGQE